MKQYIGITVADELTIVRHIDAADPQGAAGRGAVRVFAKSDAEGGRDRVPVRCL